MSATPADLDLGLELAQRLADLADELAMARFRAHDLLIERKPDLSPVTEADTRIEREMRRIIASERPQDLVIGEEYGSDAGDPGKGWCWIIDPIDGTKSFARGAESWATLIALEYGGETVVAVASMPAYRHRYYAVRGLGSHLNGEIIHVSGVDDLGAATLAHTSLSGFVWCGRDGDLRNLAGSMWDARGFGNSMGHLSVARGTADVGWTALAKLWDFAALSLIVREAGGEFTDGEGKPARGGAGISSNGLLHSAVLAAIG